VGLVRWFEGRDVEDGIGMGVCWRGDVPHSLCVRNESDAMRELVWPGQAGKRNQAKPKQVPKHGNARRTIDAHDCGWTSE
jgi:hypothetical protein